MLLPVLLSVTKMGTSLYLAHVYQARELTRLRNLEANGSFASLDCSIVETKYKDDIFDTESVDSAGMCVFLLSPFTLPLSLSFLSTKTDTEAARRLPALGKHDPASTPCYPPTTTTRTPKDTSDYIPTFDALKHEVDLVSRTIVSRLAEESDRQDRERLAKRTLRSTPIVVVSDVGGGSGARVAQKSRRPVKPSGRQSSTALPVVVESSSDLEDGLEGNRAIEVDITDDFFYKPRK